MLDAASFQRSYGETLLNPALVADLRLARALKVHRNNSAVAARDALADNFPVVRTLVGDDAFEGMTAEFIDAYPPSDPQLCRYGERLPPFIAAWRPFSQLAYLPAVATLEWMTLEALFAADAEPLDPTMFASGIDPAAPLHVHYATRVRDFDLPAVSIWRAHSGGMDEGTLNSIHWVPETALVTRPAYEVKVQTISPAAITFLNQATIGAAATACAELEGNVAEVFCDLLAAGALM